jgi:hypothetical protein
MTTFTTLKLATAVAICVAATSQSALAAAKHENLHPFTDRYLIAHASYLRANANLAAIPLAGEPKNELPFTRGA